jgi:hypothetical protein
MLRVIFDTNIYGRLAGEQDGPTLEERIRSEKEFIVYGYAPIRQEIRNIPKESKLSQRNRILLLNLYDKITGNHLLPDSIRVNHLAKKYFDYYQRSGGGYSWQSSIKFDFMIVACASIHGLDIIYSADNKTMSNKTAIKTYDHINLKEYIRTPRFLKYEDLVKQFRTQSNL